jgi:hypothetical protein
MKTITKLALLVTMISVILVTAGCGALNQATSAPTEDLGAVQTAAVATANASIDEQLNAAKTEAVATAIAAITEDAKLNPSPTVALPTLEPTTAVTTTVVVNTPVTVKTNPPAVTVPTITKTPYTDNCSVVSTTPKDYQVMTPGQDFDGVWVLKNTGKVTWTDGQYYITNVSGTIPVEKNVYYIKGDVAVNDSVEVRADMTAPTAPGTYTSNWAVVNNVGMPFCYIYVAITIP